MSNVAEMFRSVVDHEESQVEEATPSEVVEAEGEVQQNADAAEDLKEVEATLESLLVSVEAAPNFTRWDQVFVQHTLDSVAKRTGIEFSGVSLESNADDYRTISMEGIGDAIGSVFKAIWEAIKSVFNAIKNFFMKLFGMSKAKDASRDEAEKVVAASPEKTLVEVVEKKAVAKAGETVTVAGKQVKVPQGSVAVKPAVAAAVSPAPSAATPTPAPSTAKPSEPEKTEEVKIVDLNAVKEGHKFELTKEVKGLAIFYDPAYKGNRLSTGDGVWVPLNVYIEMTNAALFSSVNVKKNINLALKKVKDGLPVILKAAASGDENGIESVVEDAVFGLLSTFKNKHGYPSPKGYFKTPSYVKSGETPLVPALLQAEKICVGEMTQGDATKLLKDVRRRLKDFYKLNNLSSIDIEAEIKKLNIEAAVTSYDFGEAVSPSDRENIAKEIATGVRNIFTTINDLSQAVMKTIASTESALTKLGESYARAVKS